ncbi:NF-kappa-B-repressing factor-like [Dendronephthya gigantea]|uniref:NF-kappa-B-repressing factor-like n=1 Tax=Dendronephthya gigantea TaxID=151771 RepID=UPI0010696055|nr:NF-kappa-B-repressing factor-like [Dendronephthya gigantea]
MADRQGVIKSVWENDIQWSARREFIETHRRTIPIGQLEALSMVWANMKFLGCRYPEQTEERVRHLESSCSQAMDIPAEIKRKQDEGKKKPIIKGLTLYARDSAGPENPISLLHGSAHRSKKRIEFQELGQKQGQFSCAVVIDDILIATGEAANKKEAKRQCAERAVQILRACQPVVDELVLHQKAQVVKKDHLATGRELDAPRISENNLGSQMLRKMGWTGGGLGSEGKGRADPVLVDETQGRRGLGRDAGDGSVNKNSVKNTVRNFIMDNKKNELRFSSDLSKEDRAIVHTICQQHGLRHKSFGTGNNRYLVISKH